jgi:hypothetical protein
VVESDFTKFNARGGITYSQFTMAEALAANEKSTFKNADLSKVAPAVQLLVDKLNQDKLIEHLRTTFIPEVVKRHAAGEKKNVLEKKYADVILKTLDTGEADGWETTPPHLPLKKVYVKTKDIAPWAVATFKVTGAAGSDFTLRARVNSEDELKVPNPKLLVFPTVRPIEETVHTLYPGAWAFATVKLYAYFKNPGNYGISAYADTIAFLEDRDRLAGGGGLDEDDIFMDD